MANTKQTMLTSLATNLQALTGVSLATRDLLPPDAARAAAPYVGVISGDELNVCEDSTHIRFLLDVDLIVLVPGDTIEEVIDEIKDEIYTPTSIGALHVHYVGMEHVTLVQADEWSSARMALEVTYVGTKAGF